MAFDIVEDVICSYRALKAKYAGEAELEIRLGRQGENGGFLPGVSKDVFHLLECDMMEDCRLTPQSDTWTEIVDYHYTAANGDPIRTRVETDAGQMELKKTHISKSTVKNVTVKRTDGCDDVTRLSLSHEQPVDPPGICIPTYVRIKQQKVFADARADMGIVWVYELSKTWSANTRAAAEHLQHVTEPIYEVECELIDEHGAYTGSLSDAEVRDSLLLKIKNLFGGTDAFELECSEDAPQLKGTRRRGKKLRQNP